MITPVDIINRLRWCAEWRDCEPDILNAAASLLEAQAAAMREMWEENARLRVEAHSLRTRASTAVATITADDRQHRGEAPGFGAVGRPDLPSCLRALADLVDGTAAERAGKRPAHRTAEDERRDVLIYLRNRCAIFMASQEIERGDHVGAAKREAVKP